MTTPPSAPPAAQPDPCCTNGPGADTGHNCGDVPLPPSNFLDKIRAAGPAAQDTADGVEGALRMKNEWDAHVEAAMRWAEGHKHFPESDEAQHCLALWAEVRRLQAELARNIEERDAAVRALPLSDDTYKRIWQAANRDRDWVRKWLDAMMLAAGFTLDDDPDQVIAGIARLRDAAEFVGEVLRHTAKYGERAVVKVDGEPVCFVGNLRKTLGDLRAAIDAALSAAGGAPKETPK